MTKIPDNLTSSSILISNRSRLCERRSSPSACRTKSTCASPTRLCTLFDRRRLKPTPVSDIKVLVHNARHAFTHMLFFPHTVLPAETFEGVSRASVIQWYLKEHEAEFDTMEAVSKCCQRQEQRKMSFRFVLLSAYIFCGTRLHPTFLARPPKRLRFSGSLSRA